MPLGAGPDPNASYYAAAQANIGAAINSDLSSKDPSKQLLGFLGAGAEGQMATTDVQNAAVQSQIGQLPSEYQQAYDYTNLLGQQQLQGMGISRQQTGLQQAGTEQQYAVTQAEQAQKEKELELQATRQMQGTIGQQATGGSQMTTAGQQQVGDVAQQYAWQKASLGRQEQLSAGDYARAQQNYALVAQANGISVQEAEERLTMGLNQLGPQYDPTTLVAQGAGYAGQQASALSGILAQAGLDQGTNVNSILPGGPGGG